MKGNDGLLVKNGEMEEGEGASRKGRNDKTRMKRDGAESGKRGNQEAQVLSGGVGIVSFKDGREGKKRKNVVFVARKSA